MCKKKISEFVKEKRRSSGLSLTQFAELYNVSRAQIAKYEAGTLDDPTLLVVSKFCKNFDITGQEFIEQFQFNDSISTDPDSLIYSINHLINTVFQPDVKAYIADFFKYNYERYCLHGLNNATGPEQHMLHTDAYSSCFNRYDEHVSINAIKYKKRQIGKDTYYNNQLEYALGSLYLHPNNYNSNFILLTPSRIEYDIVSKSNFGKIDRMNIIFMYYCHKHKSEYIVVNGRDFLKDNAVV